MLIAGGSDDKALELSTHAKRTVLVFAFPSTQVLYVYIASIAYLLYIISSP